MSGCFLFHQSGNDITLEIHASDYELDKSFPWYYHIIQFLSRALHFTSFPGCVYQGNSIQRTMPNKSSRHFGSSEKSYTMQREQSLKSTERENNIKCLCM